MSYSPKEIKAFITNLAQKNFIKDVPVHKELTKRIMLHTITHSSKITGPITLEDVKNALKKFVQYEKEKAEIVTDIIGELAETKVTELEDEIVPDIIGELAETEVIELEDTTPVLTATLVAGLRTFENFLKLNKEKIEATTDTYGNIKTTLLGFISSMNNDFLEFEKRLPEEELQKLLDQKIYKFSLLQSATHMYLMKNYKDLGMTEQQLAVLFGCVDRELSKVDKEVLAVHVLRRCVNRELGKLGPLKQSTWSKICLGKRSGRLKVKNANENQLGNALTNAIDNNELSEENLIKVVESRKLQVLGKMVNFGLARGMCELFKKGWVFDYKLRVFIDRLLNYAQRYNNKPIEKYLINKQQQLDDICRFKGRSFTSETCLTYLDTATTIISHIAELQETMFTLTIPIVQAKLKVVPLNVEEFLTSIYKLEQTYKERLEEKYNNRVKKVRKNVKLTVFLLSLAKVYSFLQASPTPLVDKSLGYSFNPDLYLMQNVSQTSNPSALTGQWFMPVRGQISSSLIPDYTPVPQYPYLPRQVEPDWCDVNNCTEEERKIAEDKKAFALRDPYEKIGFDTTKLNFYMGGPEPLYDVYGHPIPQTYNELQGAIATDIGERRKMVSKRRQRMGLDDEEIPSVVDVTKTEEAASVKPEDVLKKENWCRANNCTSEELKIEQYYMDNVFSPFDANGNLDLQEYRLLQKFIKRDIVKKRSRIQRRQDIFKEKAQQYLAAQNKVYDLPRDVYDRLRLEAVEQEQQETSQDDKVFFQYLNTELEFLNKMFTRYRNEYQRGGERQIVLPNGRVYRRHFKEFAARVQRAVDIYMEMLRTDVNKKTSEDLELLAEKALEQEQREFSGLK